MFQRTLLLPSLLFISSTNGAQVTSCIDIKSWSDFTDAIDSASKNSAVNLCPFDIEHDGDETSGYDIDTDNLKIACDKKSGSAGEAFGVRKLQEVWKPNAISGEDGPKCIIRGSARHLNINAKGTTLIGLEFYGSMNTAMVVEGGAEQTNLLHLAFVGNEGGSSLEIEGGAKATSVLHCEFTDNIAGSGSLVVAPETSVAIYRTFFYDNVGNENAGGLLASESSSVTLSRSEFFNNNVVNGSGPAIYAEIESSVCDAGENRACLNSDLTTLQMCDGTFEAVDSGCEAFGLACVSPTGFPTKAPTPSPTQSYAPSCPPSILASTSPTGGLPVSGEGGDPPVPGGSNGGSKSGGGSKTDGGGSKTDGGGSKSGSVNPQGVSNDGRVLKRNRVLNHNYGNTGSKSGGSKSGDGGIGVDAAGVKCALEPQFPERRLMSQKLRRRRKV